MCSTALRWRSTIGIHDEFLCYGVLGIAPKRRQKFASRALLGEGGERIIGSEGAELAAELTDYLQPC